MSDHMNRESPVFLDSIFVRSEETRAISDKALTGRRQEDHKWLSARPFIAPAPRGLLAACKQAGALP